MNADQMNGNVPAQENLLFCITRADEELMKLKVSARI
jgi:hypothetical protein